MKMEVNSFFFALCSQDACRFCVNATMAVDSALVGTAGEWQHIREEQR